MNIKKIYLYSLILTIIIIISATYIIAQTPNPGHAVGELDLTPLYIDAVNGNVGIGTIPSKTLEVRTPGTTTFGLMSGTGSTGLSMSNDVGGLTTFSNQNGEIMQFQLDRDIIINAGNVGIGTTSPGYKLTAQGSPDSHILGVTDGARTFAVYSGALAGGNYGISIGTTSNDPLAFYTNGIDRLTIYTDGNVGINGNVDVTGNVKATGFCIGTSCITSWPTGISSQWATSGSDIYYNNGNVGIGTTNPSEALEIGNGGNLKLGIDTGAEPGKIIFAHGDGSIAKIWAGHEVVYDPSGGNYLHTLNLGTSVGTTDIPGLTLTHQGNVGIGTTSPAYKLTITSPSNNHIFGVTDGTETFAVYAGALSDGSNGISIGTTTNHPLAFYTNGIDRLTIYTDGNVGIDGNVNVVGDVDAAGFCIAGDCKTSWAEAGISSQWTTNGNDIYYNNGNVGIGTIPSKTLEVRTPGTTTFGLMSGTGSTGLSMSNDVNGLTTFSNQNGEIMQFQLDRDIIINAGNVGIGTTDPQSLLDVNGDVSVTGDISATGVIVTGDISATGTIRAGSLGRENCVWSGLICGSSPLRLIAPEGAYVAGIEHKGGTGGEDCARIYSCYP